jgi:hypothetical protein
VVAGEILAANAAQRNADRRDLVDRIVKLGFANKRGYQLLGGARHGGR